MGPEASSCFDSEVARWINIQYLAPLKGWRLILMINISAAEYEEIQRERIQTKVSTGFDQLDKGEYSNCSVKDILKNAKEIHEKIQTGTTS